MMAENRDYDALLQNISNLGDITSSEHNATNILLLLNGHPDWSKTLFLVGNELASPHTEEFAGKEIDDLGWLGYFIGRSKELEVLEVHYLPEEREQVDAFMRGVACNQSIKKLTIRADIGDQGFERLAYFLQNNNALAHLRFVNCHVGRDRAHYIAMAMEQCRHNSLIRFDLDNSNVSTEGFVEIATALSSQPQLEDLYLGLNNIGRDGCVSLGNTLRSCPSLQVISLSNNNIDDLGLQALTEGMTNCSNMRTINLSDNRSITAAGLRSMSPLLQSESCSLQLIALENINFGDEGAIALADGLRDNKSMINLMFAPTSAGVTEVGWAAFSQLLCDTSSINNTYLSNHSLEWVGLFYDMPGTPPDIRQYLLWNKDERIDAAICKILTTHDHFDMKPFFRWKLKILPVMVAWFKRAQEAGLEQSLESRKLSSMYDFVRSMPMLVCKEKARRRSRKRRLDGEAKL